MKKLSLIVMLFVCKVCYSQTYSGQNAIPERFYKKEEFMRYDSTEGVVSYYRKQGMTIYVYPAIKIDQVIRITEGREIRMENRIYKIKLLTGKQVEINLSKNYTFIPKQYLQD